MSEFLGDIRVPGKKYLDKNNKERTEWHTAGAAFEAKDGGDGVNCEVFPGMALTGRFIIRPRNEQEEAPEPGHDFMG